MNETSVYHVCRFLKISTVWSWILGAFLCTIRLIIHSISSLSVKWLTCVAIAQHYFSSSSCFWDKITFERCNGCAWLVALAIFYIFVYICARKKLYLWAFGEILLVILGCFVTSIYFPSFMIINLLFDTMVQNVKLGSA